MPTWFPAGGSMVLVHERTREVIATRVELAVTRRARRVGLLGRAGLDTDAGLLLAPCFAIHTAFMRFPIDVLFVDRTGRALRVVYGLAPWRVAVSTRAHAVIELAAGVLRRHPVEVGDQLTLLPRRPGPSGPGSEAGPKGPALRAWDVGVDEAKRISC